jgi:hypothetical protein
MALRPNGGLQDAKEETQSGRDRHQASIGGSADSTRPIGCGGGPVDRGNRSYLLPVAVRIRRPEGDQVKRLKELEAKNTPLRRAVADLTLEKLILKEGSSGTVGLR